MPYVVAFLAFVALLAFVPPGGFEGEGLSAIWDEWDSLGIDFTVESIPRTEYSADSDWVRSVTKMRVPVLITNSPSLEWGASKKWTPEYLSKQVPSLTNVKVKADGNDFVFSEEKLPLTSFVENELGWKDRYGKVNMSTSDFFAHCTKSAGTSMNVYYSGHVNLWSDLPVREDIGTYLTCWTHFPFVSFLFFVFCVWFICLFVCLFLFFLPICLSFIPVLFFVFHFSFAFVPLPLTFLVDVAVRRCRFVSFISAHF